MEFLSRPDDKKPRWIITDGNPEPKLIEEQRAQDTSNKDNEKGKSASCIIGLSYNVTGQLHKQVQL